MARANYCQSGSSCTEYLVKFAPQASPEQIGALLQRENLVQAAYLERLKIYHLVGSAGQAQADVLRRLNEDPLVQYAEPNYPVQSETIPNDPRFSELWAFRNTGQLSGTIGVDMDVDEVWNSLTGSSSMIVAVLDTGVDYRHEDLAQNMWHNTREVPGNGIDDDHNGLVDDYYGYNFFNHTSDPMDNYFHGTHVAGTIGAVGNNGIGITGINWHVKIMALKVLDSTGNGSLSDVVSGINYAVANGAKVINSSWAFPAGLTGLPNDPNLEPSQILRDAIEAADQAGVIFVAAAGNHSVNSDLQPRYPASYSLGNIISVAATDKNDTLALFSNYGATSIDLGAPGVSILSTYPSDPTRPYVYASGTSMAAPHVAGAAALIWSSNPSLSHRQVIDMVLQGVEADPYLQGKTVTGGRLNIARSLSLGAPQVNHPPTAYAGPNQTKLLGQSVSLSGTGSDVDGDALTYAWTLTVPTGSQAVLSSRTSAQTGFTPDLAGTYRATLVVSDGSSSSLASTATIQVTSSTTSILPPTINVKLKRNGTITTSTQLNVGELLSMDASGSRSQNGLSLTYRWAFTERPSGSAALLNNASSSIASFRPDKIGRYSVSLTVSDSKSSSRSSVIVTAGSTLSASAPSISVRLKRNGVALSSTQVLVNDLISADASGTVPNGPLPLSFQWSFALRPTGSAAILSTPTSAVTSFRPDRVGQYILGLSVSNGSYTSKAQFALYANAIQSAGEVDLEIMEGPVDEETALQCEGEICSLPPNVSVEASEGGEAIELDVMRGTNVEVGKAIDLNGASSISVLNQTLEYRWSLESKPTDSQISLASSAAETRFEPDVPGSYILKLSVQDGEMESSVELSFIAQSQDLEPEGTGEGGNAAAGSGGCALQGQSGPAPWQAAIAFLGLLLLWRLKLKKA